MTTRGRARARRKSLRRERAPPSRIEVALERSHDAPNQTESAAGPEGPATVQRLPDGALILLERLAQSLRIDLVVLDQQQQRRLVVEHGSTLFRSTETIRCLVKRLQPCLDAGGVAISHADPRMSDGAEVCAFRVLDAMVLVASGPAHPRAPSSHGLTKLYGLTPAEARVASLLALELSPGEIAEELDVGLSTIRTHLKAIRAKLFAESQTDLIRRLLHSAAVFYPG